MRPLWTPRWACGWRPPATPMPTCSSPPVRPASAPSRTGRPRCATTTTSRRSRRSLRSSRPTPRPTTPTATAKRPRRPPPSAPGSWTFPRCAAPGWSRTVCRRSFPPPRCASRACATSTGATASGPNWCWGSSRRPRRPIRSRSPSGPCPTRRSPRCSSSRATPCARCWPRTASACCCATRTAPRPNASPGTPCRWPPTSAPATGSGWRARASPRRRWTRCSA